MDIRTKRSEVLTLAWELVKNKAISFGEAQKLAWNAINVKNEMAKAIVEFCFIKSNGERRIARGTRSPEFIPASKSPKGTGRKRKKNPNQISYYDLDKQAWRSFNGHKLVNLNDQDSMFVYSLSLAA